MKVLVTGASGFVAPYLAAELESHGHTVFMTSRKRPARLPGRATFEPLDLLDFPQLKSFLADISPHAVVHLSGFSSVGRSWDARADLVQANVAITNNICRVLWESGARVQFLFSSSAMVYGNPPAADTLLDEASPARPDIPYGMSKLAAEYVVRAYASESFRPVVARSFNHIGPGQSTDFVCSALAERVAGAPQKGEIHVGNLSARRDFSDVRDIVRAYRLILEKKPKHDLFVLGSGRATAIQEILNKYIAISGKKISAIPDLALMRAVDPAAIIANPARAHKVLGWKCEIPLEQTLKDMYKEAQSRVAQPL